EYYWVTTSFRIIIYRPLPYTSCSIFREKRIFNNHRKSFYFLQGKSSSLRKVKTDVIDARHLCELYYKEELEPQKKRGIQLLNLRNLTRQHDNITNLYVQTKLQFHSVLDQVFPEYRGVFGDLYSTVSLLTLLNYGTSNDVLKTDKDIL